MHFRGHYHVQDLHMQLITQAGRMILWHAFVEKQEKHSSKEPELGSWEKEEEKKEEGKKKITSEDYKRECGEKI